MPHLTDPDCPVWYKLRCARKREPERKRKYRRLRTRIRQSEVLGFLPSERKRPPAICAPDGLPCRRLYDHCLGDQPCPYADDGSSPLDPDLLSDPDYEPACLTAGPDGGRCYRFRRACKRLVDLCPFRWKTQWQCDFCGEFVPIGLILFVHPLPNGGIMEDEQRESQDGTPHYVVCKGCWEEWHLHLAADRQRGGRSLLHVW